MLQKNWASQKGHCTARLKNMTLKFKILIVTVLTGLCAVSCYNFKGISIPPDIKTFNVENFTLTEPDAPIDLNQIFTEALRKKIREESRLVNDDTNPDISISGSVLSYNIRFVAPDENNTTSLNRLEIGVKVIYTSEINEDDSWTKNYTDFEDFDSNTDFQSIQDDLIEEIVLDIVERIFNDSFTNW